MLVGGIYGDGGLGDLGKIRIGNPIKKVTRAVGSAVKGTAKAASGGASFLSKKLPTAVGSAVFAPALLTTKATVSLAKGVVGTAGKVAGTVVKAPIDIVGAAAGGFGSRFASAQSERTPEQRQESADAAAAAAADVINQQQTRYSAGGAGGAASGGTELQTTSHGLTMEGPPAAGGMSMAVKVAIAGGALLAAYLLYRQFGGRSARRSKS